MRNLSLSVIIIGLLSTSLKADDTVTIDQVPAPVKDAITTAIATGTLEKIEKEDEDGATAFETTYTFGGLRCESVFSVDGKLMPESDEDDKQGDHKDDTKDDHHVDVLVTISQVPAVVRSAITSTVANGTLTEIEQQHDHGVTKYEITYEIDDTAHESTFGEDGKRLPEEDQAVEAKP